MNCIDNECCHLYCYGDESYCELTGSEIPDDVDVTQCENYVQAHTCIDCIHAKTEVYETGTIDEIDYRCPFQNNKLIYVDETLHRHYVGVPECNVGKFEKEN